MAKVDMVMPQMGESIAEGTIVRWLKKEGETVERDEIILEISTDKVDSEIPSPHAGVVEKILAAEGDTIKVGEVIAKIATDAEEGQEDGDGRADSSDEDNAKAEADTADAQEAPEEEEQVAEEKAQPKAAASSKSADSQDGEVVDMLMPQMGESITEGTIVRWLKKKGEKVERDEILLEISTDKVDSEIPSPHEGILQEILAGEGDTVEVGSAIAKIATGAGVPSEETQENNKSVQDSAPKPETVAKEVQTAPGKQAATPKQPVETNGERKFYSPLVRRIARAEGIGADELVLIPGTGAYGRVTKQDILNYLDTRPEERGGVAAPSQARPTQQAPAKPEIKSEPAKGKYDEGQVEIIPMDPMRKSIAKHMVATVQTSPHVFAVSEADMTNLVSYRSENKDVFLQKTGTKLSYMPFITYAAAKALQDYPLVNSSVDGDSIIRKKNINIGIAVALQNNGLIVPVIKNADGLNIVGLGRAINDLAARARSKKLRPDEVQDGTFSITNMGSFGSLMGFPLINQPQVAILGVGAIQKRPVVINDAIAVRSMMYVSLSFDHRIVDGALAGQFLDRVAQYLTEFDTDIIL